MKSYVFLYETCISFDNRKEAVHNAFKSKRVRKIAKHRHLTEEDVVRLSLIWIRHYKEIKHKPIYIREGIAQKERKLLVPTLEELVVQHCVVNALKPIFMRGMYAHSYASIPRRGAHKGKKALSKWIRNDPENCRYCLKLDIRHFFDSIPHDVLRIKLARKIKDHRMLGLIYTIINTTGTGLPLGFYTSQWLANWYLEDFDHFVKEKLRVKHYIRYMDDIVIFGNSSEWLHDVKNAISEYFHLLGLVVKSNWQVFEFSHDNRGRFLDFMGFRFYHNRVTLRKAIMLRSTRKASRIARKSAPNVHDARQMLSYIGWFKHSDTYDVYDKHVASIVNIKALKHIVSRKDKSKERRTPCKLRFTNRNQRYALTV